jgi:hypothetical protein
MGGDRDKTQHEKFISRRGNSSTARKRGVAGCVRADRVSVASDRIAPRVCARAIRHPLGTVSVWAMRGLPQCAESPQQAPAKMKLYSHIQWLLSQDILVDCSIDPCDNIPLYRLIKLEMLFCRCVWCGCEVQQEALQQQHHVLWPQYDASLVFLLQGLLKLYACLFGAIV